MSPVHIGLYDRISKNKSKTFVCLYDVEIVEISMPSGQTSTVKADRDLFRRLLSASVSGRDIDIPFLLHHELSPVPLSLASVDGTLNAADKAPLFHLLCDEFIMPTGPAMDQETCTVIDAMGIVQALGKPAKATTLAIYRTFFAI